MAPKSGQTGSGRFIRWKALACSLCLLCLVAAVFGSLPAQARIIRIDIDRVQFPTFDGARYGRAGQYEKIIGRAYGELDPKLPPNALITDIALAPRNARGKVEYVTQFYMLKPVDMKQANGLLYYNVLNRGNKGGFDTMNLGAVGGNDPTYPSDAGDGYALRRGYTFLWSGWQADVLRGYNRMSIQVPVAKNPDGSEITGRIRTEFIVNRRTGTLNLSSGPFTGSNHSSYETVSLDTNTTTLTYRSKEADRRIVVPGNQWAFADCTETPFPGVPSSRTVCLRGDFDPNFIYELIYTAKNPLVLGIGFAATRDLISFFRHADRDEAGRLNPLANGIRAAVMEGASQSGRYIRSFLELGFNQDETGKIVFEGMNPHIATGLIPLDVRFGQPGRAYGQHEEHLFPAHESTLTWGRVYDPVAKRTGSLLDSCQKTRTCPKIIQTVSSTEYWQGRMSLNTTDAWGRHDLEIPNFVRIYHLAGTQHAPADEPRLGVCQQLSNPDSYEEIRRALLVALERWVLEGVDPPPSRFPTLRNGTLVPPDKASIGWPNVPGVKYTGLVDQLPQLEYGKGFNFFNESGMIAEPPTIGRGRYVVLVPKVDADGNEIDGIRSTTLRAPIGTYAGWNLRRAGFAEDELCGLQGSFIPFRKTKAEREAAGDPRPSLEERYGDHDGYVAAVKTAANDLMTAGFLLPEDVAFLVLAAKHGDVLQ